MTPAQLDDILARYDREWGPCRLPTLVSEATAAKLQIVKDAMEAGTASWAASPADIRAAMARAYAAMEREALEAGCQPLPPAVAEIRGSKALYAFAFDDTHRQALVLRYAHEQRPVCIWSADDLLALVDGPGITQEAFRLFPGSSVQPATYREGRRRAEFGDRLDDVLPLDAKRFTGTHCAECRQPQWHSPGGITCDSGHGGAGSVEDAA